MRQEGFQGKTSLDYTVKKESALGEGGWEEKGKQTSLPSTFENKIKYSWENI